MTDTPTGPYAVFTRGGFRSRDCWSWALYAADGTYLDGGKEWWLRQDSAREELEGRYPGVEVRGRVAGAPF